MNPDPAYADTIIRAWLAEPVYFPPQDLGHIAALVHETPQRRSRWSAPLLRSRSMFSAPKMITAAAIIGMAGWFLTAGVSSPSPDLAPASAPSASLEASAAPSAEPSAAPAARDRKITDAQFEQMWRLQTYRDDAGVMQEVPADLAIDLGFFGGAVWIELPCGTFESTYERRGTSLTIWAPFEQVGLDYFEEPVACDPVDQGRDASILHRLGTPDLRLSLIDETLALQQEDPTGEVVLSFELLSAASPVPSAAVEPSAAAIVLETPAMRLEADRIRVKDGDASFEMPAQPMLLERVGEDTRTLIAAWVDDGLERQLRFALGADETDWWIIGVAWSDGTTLERNRRTTIASRDIAKETRTPLGEMLAADLRLTEGRKTPALIIDGLRLSAFMPSTNPAPLTGTGCRMLTDGEKVSIADLPEDVVDAHDRLVALGICHDFRYTYQVADPAFEDLVAVERWCTPPPVQEARSYTRAERELRASDPFGNVQAWPYETLADGSVRIHVEEELARPYRAQPPAGWDCPTR
jgi:hypothetical protein